MAQESWGIHSRPDPLVDHLYNIFADNHLVDTCPCSLPPAWNNQRVGDEHVGKRLDRFLVQEDLVESLKNLKSRVYK